MLPWSSVWLRRTVSSALIAGGLISARAEPAAPVIPDFDSVTWLPAAGSALANASAAADGIAVAPAGTDNRKGDSVTILVQTTEGKSRRQWAVVLSINDIKPDERTLRTPPFSLYLSNGSQVDFAASGYTGMLIHVFGPFTDGKDAAGARGTWSGSLVSPQFLGLGLDGTAALFSRVHDMAAANPDLRERSISFGVRSRPFPPGQIAPNRGLLEPFKITKEEERAYAGFMPAMTDFFRIASQTPGVRNILFEVLDLPWWSLVAHGGQITEVNFELVGPFESLAPADWGLPPEMRVYSLGLRLDLYGKPALHCRFALTAPRVPLLNSAGIVGLAVMRPDGKGPRLMIRVMAARPAAARE